MSTEDFRLTTTCVVNRLRDRFGVSRSADTIRMWGRTGKLPVLELENGQRLFVAPTSTSSARAWPQT